MDNIITTHKHYATKYYIQILMLQENFHKRYLPNVFTRKFVVRKTAPLPEYDTTLYSFDNQEDKLCFHWTVPSAETCAYLDEHETELDEADRDLYNHIKKFAPQKISTLSL